ncbi:hypothetical protein D3248_11985 [Leucobacter zeae]|nr:hypothetical protein [Leucobacter zeae]
MLDTMHRRARRAGLALVAAAALSVAVPIGTSAAQAADPIPGEPSSGDSLFPGIGNTGYDAEHYDVRLVYREDGTISAEATLTATAAAPLESFSLDFEGLSVDAVRVNGVDASSFSRSADPAKTAHKLEVVPVEAVPEGEFTVEVVYSGRPTTHIDPDGSFEGWVSTDDGATALGQPVGAMTWLPSNNTPADKATFDVAITIPDRIGDTEAAAVSNGELVSRTPLGDGTTTWSWKQERPMSTMASLVSIGGYEVIEDEVELSDGSTIPEWSFVDPAIGSEARESIAANRARIGEIIRFLEGMYGPYPGGSTGVVVDVTDLGYALETQDRPYFEGDVSLGTLVHELAHQWFGDSVSPADWNSIWIGEGMATYASARFAQEVLGEEPAGEALFGQWSSRPTAAAEWTIAPAGMEDPADLFGWQTHRRAAMASEALQQALTPEVFAQLLTEWNARNAGTSRTTADFRALAEELSGHDLEPFFDDWIFDADKPAWPGAWSLDLAGEPQEGVVDPGETIEYRVTASSTGRVPLAGATVAVDLGELLRSAAVDASSLPTGLALSGSTLTWTVPETGSGRRAEVAFAATVLPEASGAGIPVSVRAGTLGATCGDCAVAHTVSGDPGSSTDIDAESDAEPGAGASSAASGANGTGVNASGANGTGANGAGANGTGADAAVNAASRAGGAGSDSVGADAQAERPAASGPGALERTGGTNVTPWLIGAGGVIVLAAILLGVAAAKRRRADRDGAGSDAPEDG